MFNKYVFKVVGKHALIAAGFAAATTIVVDLAVLAKRLND